MKSENLLTILLGLLIVISAVQAYQLVNLKGAISQGVTATASTPQTQYSSGVQSASSGSSSGSAASSSSSGLANAPNMVGGC